MTRRISQWMPFALAWFHAKLRPATFRATCARCPNWIRQGNHNAGRIGVCALDKAKIYNDFTTGFALKAWTADDQCSRHPLYNKRPVAGSDLVMDPADPVTQKFGGFNRLPAFAEAMKMAVAQHEKSAANAANPVLPDHGPRLVMGGETVNDPGNAPDNDQTRVN